MPKTRKQKEENVSTLKAVLKAAGSTVFVGFNRFKVTDERVLRKQLRESGVSYTVTKKSLLARAVEGLSELPGQVAIAFGPDSILPAKGIAQFIKTRLRGQEHEGVMSILGGIFEGKLVDARKMQEIALIPDRQTLLSMLANVLNAPIQGLAIALDAVAKS